MTATRRIHIVVAALIALTVVLGAGWGSAALAAAAEEQVAGGSHPGAGSITIQATPSSVPEGGGEVELFALVRDRQGRPLKDASVNFLTETGTLASRGRLMATGTDGGVTERLTVTAAELATTGGHRFWVSAAVGSGSADPRSVNVSVRVRRGPEANFEYQAGGLLVTFQDRSGGLVTDWEWDFGDGAEGTGKSPTHTFAEAGFYAVTLRATNTVGSDETTRLVHVLDPR